MDQNELNQYFELALDLPGSERARLLRRVDKMDPALGRELRQLLSDASKHQHFAASSTPATMPSLPTRDLDSITEVAVPTKDVRKAVAWYREHFECTVSELDDARAVLTFANIDLVLQRTQPMALQIGRSAADDADGTSPANRRDPSGNRISLHPRNSS